MKKETICWNCQNYSKCSWSIGIPVENWDATPTEYIDIQGKDHKPHIVKGFCVNSCPQFKADPIQKCKVEEICKIIGFKKCKFFDWVKVKSKLAIIQEILKEKGFKLHIYDKVCNDNEAKIIKQYYLEKVNNES